MHQTAKGRPWYFGMKAHLGVDSRRKLIHTVAATARLRGGQHRFTETPAWAGDAGVWGDQAYPGQTTVIRQCAPQARDFTQRRCRLRGRVDRREQEKNRLKSKGRAKVEHGIGVINGQLDKQYCWWRLC